MTITANAIWQVLASGAADTNGGGFDPSIATGVSDLASTNGTSSTPTVTSATYTFVAGDVGNWLFVKSGTNWTAGWYQISSVSGGGVVLNAAIGAAILYNGATFYNTAAGVGSAASLSSGTGSVDYSQNGTAELALTGESTATTTVTTTAAAFTQVMVGNAMYLSGTGITTGVYFMTAYASSLSCTIDRSAGTTGTSVVVNLGGALASPGQAGANHVGGNIIWCNGSFSITSASTNVTVGCPSLAGGTAALATSIVGFSSLRGDQGTSTFTASGISSFTLVALGTNGFAANLTLDCANLTSGRGLQFNANEGVALLVNVKNAKNTGISSGVTTSTAVLCSATGCSGAQYVINQVNCYYCVAYNNTPSIAAFQAGNCASVGCAAIDNTGSGIYGFYDGGGTLSASNCLAYGNGGSGYRHSQGGQNSGTLLNCRSEKNGASGAGYGYDSSALDNNFRIINCSGWSNTSGNINTAKIAAGNVLGFLQPSADPNVNAAGLNFALNPLNNTAGAGAILRAAGIPTPSGAFAMPLLSTASYGDVGPFQSQCLFFF